MDIIRTYELNGQILQLARVDPEAPVNAPAPAAAATAPGAGEFEVRGLKLSADKIAAGEALTLSAQISGSKIAFIYSEILFFDAELEQYYGPVAREFVPAAQEKHIAGINHPDWGTDFSVELTLTPSLRLLTDGSQSAFAFLLPKGYSNQDTQLEGCYTASEGGVPRPARLTFDPSGEIKKALVYKELSNRSFPRALNFNEKDQFTPFVQILSAPTAENAEWQVSKGLSTPLTWRDQAMHWVSAPLLPGAYLAGLLVQDLDGKIARYYAPFSLAG